MRCPRLGLMDLGTRGVDMVESGKLRVEGQKKETGIFILKDAAWILLWVGGAGT